MTMTKITSRKPSGTYGHGPLKICFWKGKDDDHDQDFLKREPSGTYGHGPLINLVHLRLVWQFAHPKRGVLRRRVLGMRLPTWNASECEVARSGSY